MNVEYVETSCLVANLRGADLWHVACALYLTSDPESQLLAKLRATQFLPDMSLRALTRAETTLNESFLPSYRFSSRCGCNLTARNRRGSDIIAVDG